MRPLLGVLMLCLLLVSGCSESTFSQVTSQIGSEIPADESPVASAAPIVGEASPTTATIFDQVGSAIGEASPTTATIFDQVGSAIVEASPSPSATTPISMSECNLIEAEIGGNLTAEIVLDEDKSIWYSPDYPLAPRILNTFTFGGIERRGDYSITPYALLGLILERAGDAEKVDIYIPAGVYTIGNPEGDPIITTIHICPPIKK